MLYKIKELLLRLGIIRMTFLKSQRINPKQVNSIQFAVYEDFKDELRILKTVDSKKEIEEILRIFNQSIQEKGAKVLTDYEVILLFKNREKKIYRLNNWCLRPAVAASAYAFLWRLKPELIKPYLPTVNQK